MASFSPSTIPPVLDDRASRGSLHHGGIGLDNIEEMQQHVVACGVALVQPLTERQTPDGRFRMVVFRDPQGNFVELLAPPGA